MNPNVDLRQLAVSRSGNGREPVARQRRRLVTRLVLPGAVVLGFVAVLAWAARDKLLPSHPVTVVPVLTSQSELQDEGTPLFQAAGWIEPRPTPVYVTSLTDGVLDKLLVVEGQEVKEGEPVAQLIEDDARLALKETETHLQLQLAEVDATLAEKQTELKTLPSRREAARAKAAFCHVSYERDVKAGAAVTELTRLSSKSDYEQASAAAEELEAREGGLKKEIETLQAKREALGEHCQSLVDTAKLRMKRTVIRAPANGRVLSLVARPGMRVMGLDPHSLFDSSTVVTLYDPAMLQVRADVRLEDVPRVVPGQRVKIDTPAAPGGLDGEVLFSTSQADIQKNTLQIKVGIKNAPPTVRPDMLVQVTFLAPPSPKGEIADKDAVKLLVPRGLVDLADGGSRVWIADENADVARLKTIKVGRQAGELVEVVDGLSPADKLIAGGRDGLKDGSRIRIAGEDSLASIGTQGGSARPSRLPTKGSGHDGHNGGQ
jgi:multidrug efflux pump subunit AcrA (membrane-fusion protein)